MQQPQFSDMMGEMLVRYTDECLTPITWTFQPAFLGSRLVSSVDANYSKRHILKFQ